MKNFTKIALFLLGVTSGAGLLAKSSNCSSNCKEQDDITGHTFFSNRPHFQSCMPEKDALFRTNEMNRRDGGIGLAAEVVVYGGQSTDSKDLARFFFPWNETRLVVSEQFVPADADNNQDLDATKMIEARNFNIVTVDQNFTSTISIRPEQSSIGVGFDFMQALWRDENDQMKMYLDVSFPVERITNKMNLCEVVSNSGGGAAPTLGLDGAPHVGNMIDAFKQSNWKYGKINDRHCMSKWGVGDIEIKIGGRGYQTDSAYFTSYFGVVVPTGTKVDKKHAEYVFQPIIGNNHHWGFLFGSYHHFDVWQKGHHTLRASWALGSRILAANKQVRSFALKDKQYSQYLELYLTQTQAEQALDTTSSATGTSGINVLTHCVTVDPRYSVDVNSALYYQHCNFMAEVGYNVFARHGERVKLCNWEDVSAIKDVNGLGSTSLARTIRKNFNESAIALEDYNDAVITLDDLDLASAAHPALVSSLVYLTLGYQADLCSFPSVFSLGGSYEFSSVNAIIDRWTVWGKWSVSF